MRILLTPEERAARQKARMARYYAANKEKFLEATKKRRALNPLERKSHDALYRARNAEKVRESKEKYRIANLEKVAAAKRVWREENPEKMRQARECWEANNPERKKVHRENRRARERSAPGDLSPDIALRLLELQRGRCGVCRSELGSDRELDHIFPLALGGENSDSNMQLLCRPCNRSKGKKHPVDFMQSKGLLL